MAKCSNCGAELNVGAKFCEECGTPVPQTKTCPKCGAQLKPEAKFCSECGYSFAAKSAPSAKAGVSVGDKNVIAGDVIGESYKITGNATIVKNEDETKKMVRCHVCGRNMPITESITCVSCGEHTCESCMDLRVKSCKTCVESAAREQENVYRQAVVHTLEAGVVTLAERRELKALQKQLGLTDARVDEIENQLRADAGRKQVEAQALSSFEKIALERAVETFYGEGDTDAAFVSVEPIYSRHSDDERVVSFYAAVLAAKDPNAARAFVDGLHADILGVKLAGIDAALAEKDLNDAETRLASVARIWPDNVLYKCRQIAFLLAMNEQLSDKSFLDQANELALDLPEGETKLEKSYVERTIRRVMKATGEAVEDLSSEECNERGLYSFLLKVDESSGVQLWKNGPYWAECNIGATKPEDSGYFFWWGDTVGYKRNSSDTGWVSVKGGSSFAFSEDNCRTFGPDDDRLRSMGIIDSSANLTMDHDAAAVHHGSSWRMPTTEDFDQMLANCKISWTTRNGVHGYEVTGKGSYSSKSIFLPAAGIARNSEKLYSGNEARYWASTSIDDVELGSDCPEDAWTLTFNESYFDSEGGCRYEGGPIRPVRGAAK